MAITVNRTVSPQVINVPRADMLLVQASPEIRQLDLESFRRECREIKDSLDGRPYPRLIDYVAPVTVGSTQLAAIIEVTSAYTVTFEDGLYAVDLAGANSNVFEKTNRNQVSLLANNSAGLTYSKQVEDQSFEGRVSIDIDNGTPGTQFPRGTPGDPVNNLADAQAIIQVRNLPKKLSLLGALTVDPGEDISGYDIAGGYFADSLLTLSAGSTSDNIRVSNCTMSGGFHGASSRYDNCLIINATGLDGYCSRSKLGGLLTITGDSDFYFCYGTAAFIEAVDDLSINIVNFAGNATIANLTGSGSRCSIGVTSGVVAIDQTCIAGEITVVDADSQIDDQSGPSCTVIEVNQHIITQQNLQSAIDILEADEEIRASTYRKLHKDTKQEIVAKDVSQIGNDIDLTEQP